MKRSLVSVSVLLLACAIALSLAAHVFSVFPFDMKVTHELQEEKNPVFAAVMQGVSALGDPAIEALLIGGATLFFLVRRQFIEAVSMLVTVSRANRGDKGPRCPPTTTF